MPSEHAIKTAQAQLHQQELDALTQRLETAEQERDYLLAENRRLLASLFEEQRQARMVRRVLGLEDQGGYDEILPALASLRGKDTPSCPPVAEVAPEATPKKKRSRRAKGGEQ